MAEVLSALLDRLPASDRPVPRFDGPGTAEARFSVPAADPAVHPAVLRVAEVIAALQDLDQSRYSFVADVGDSWFIGLELRADVFLAAGYYASMGFAVPAALGAGIADPTRRPFVLVGDGAFQMTGIELATHVDQGLRPIVLLLNNGGYGMLEAIDRPRDYYERRSWDYPALARSLGAEAERVTSLAELGQALQRAEAAKGAYVIEAFTATDDLSPVMARIRAHVHAAFRNPDRTLTIASRTCGLDFDLGSIYNLNMERDEGRSRFLERISGDCIAVRVRLINRVVTALYDEAMRPHGIRVSQMNILVAVARLGKARPADICRMLRLEKSTLSRDVEMMKSKGWLESDPPAGGRNQVLRITSEGLELLANPSPPGSRPSPRPAY